MNKKFFDYKEQQVLDSLKKKIHGKNVLVVTCGPSMSNWRTIYDGYPSNSKPIVFCIKQSVDFVGELCDVHILNEVNLIKYKYKNNKPKIIFGLGDYEKRWFGFVKRDISYTVKSAENLSESMAGKAISHLKQSLFKKEFLFGPVVRWGPGIMYECVLPLLIDSKPKTITTVGWDIADANGVNVHYLDDQAAEENVIDFNKCFVTKLKSGTVNILLKNTLSSKIHDYYRNFSLIIKYNLGLKVNKVTMIDGEAEIVSCLIPLVRELCEKDGIKLNILSESSWMRK